MEQEKSGAPGGTRTPDLLVRRGISRYTPTHAVQQEPMKSTRRHNSSRTVLAALVPRSRTITRTIPVSTALGMGQCGPRCNFKRPCSIFRRCCSISASTMRICSSNPCVNLRSCRRSSSFCQRIASSVSFVCPCFCRATNTGISFGWIGHDAVGLRVPGTGRCGFRLRCIPIRSSKPYVLPLRQFTRRYGCSLLNNSSPVDNRDAENQRQLANVCRTVKAGLPQSARRYSVFPSDCLPDVPLQVSDSWNVASECPRSVRVFEACQHAS